MATLRYTYKNAATRHPDIEVAYYAYERHIATAIVYDDEPLPWHGDRTTINGIQYHVVGVEPGRVDIELYTFPTTLTSYLFMLHSMTEAQYSQWLRSLSYEQLNTWSKWLRYGDGDRVTQLEACQCTVHDGTIVYHNGIWEAYNADYLVSATASTLAELLNTWAEATEHVSYDLPE